MKTTTDYFMLAGNISTVVLALMFCALAWAQPSKVSQPPKNQLFMIKAVPYDLCKEIVSSLVAEPHTRLSVFVNGHLFNSSSFTPGVHPSMTGAAAFCNPGANNRIVASETSG